MFLRVKSSERVLVASVLIFSSLLMVTTSSAGTLPAPTVVISVLGITSASQSGCLTRYVAGPPALGSTQMTVTFANYTQGAQVQFRISDPSDPSETWITHLIDYVSSPAQCNNMMEASGSWFPVTIPSGSTSLTIIGLPGSLPDEGGYFQSLYVDGANSSVVTATVIAQNSLPTTTPPANPTTTGTSDTGASPGSIFSPRLSCTHYVFLGAPGSGQSGDYLGEEVGQLYNALKVSPTFSSSISAYSLSTPVGGEFENVVYPAVGVPLTNPTGGAWDDYIQSMWAGGIGYSQILGAMFTACPTSHFILAGYSQGAGVIHEILENYALNSMPDKLHFEQYVVAAVEIADPFAAPSDLKVDGNPGPASIWQVGGWGIVPIIAQMQFNPKGGVDGLLSWMVKGTADEAIQIGKAFASAFDGRDEVCLATSWSLTRLESCFASQVLPAGVRGLDALYTLVSPIGAITALQDEHYLTPSSKLSECLGVPVVSAAEAGDIVADPMGNLTLASGNSWNATIHVDAYKNNSLLSTNVVNFIKDSAATHKSTSSC